MISFIVISTETLSRAWAKLCAICCGSKGQLCSSTVWTLNCETRIKSACNGLSQSARALVTILVIATVCSTSSEWVKSNTLKKGYELIISLSGFPTFHWGSTLCSRRIAFLELPIEDHEICPPFSSCWNLNFDLRMLLIHVSHAYFPL